MAKGKKKKAPKKPSKKKPYKAPKKRKQPVAEENG